MEKTKLPSLVTILILTLVTVVMWVGFSVYRAFGLRPAPSVPQSISATLNPTLDSVTINQIESRLNLAGSQIPEVSISSASATPTAKPVITPTASPSASPTATASATPSGP